jgi:hypothetical protein
MWANTGAAAGSLAVWLAVSPRWGLVALGLTVCSVGCRVLRARWREGDWWNR